MGSDQSSYEDSCITETLIDHDFCKQIMRLVTSHWALTVH